MSLIYVTRAVECPTLAEVLGWMGRNGWAFARHMSAMWDTYEIPNTRCMLDVPLCEGAPGSSRRIGELINGLSAYSDQCSADIYDDIVAHRSKE